MPNHLTSKLDSLQPTHPEGDYIFWQDIDSIHPKMYLITNQLLEYTFADDAAKVLFLCFMAELSDKDLKECFPSLFLL